MKYTIRTIEPQDDLQVEAVIRACLVEYGANHEGTAWADPDLCRFSQIYRIPGCRYWVALEGERVVGGVGIGPLPGVPGVCELQKMYCLPAARGTGIAQELLDMALEYAAEYYDKVYLETLPNMTTAQRFYEKNGFTHLPGPLAQTGHFACDVCYLREL